MSRLTPITVWLSATLVVACAHDGGWTDDVAPDAAPGTTSASPDPSTCPPCVTDNDCTSGELCSQFSGDSFCAATCPNGDECDATHACQTITTVTGDEARVCVPNANACGPTPGPNEIMSADGGTQQVNTCPGLDDPNTTGGCSSCTKYHQTCQANGCYGGWWCNEQTLKCQSPPQNCSGTPDGGGGTDGGQIQTTDGGTSTSTIGSNGGTESTLYFAIIGDTRPPVINDTKAYPTTTITQIFGDVESLNPRPPFVVTTGDYMFASTTSSEATPQLKLYQSARAHYSGVDFPAMGNHECTGATVSNCGSGNKNGVTTNYTAFMQTMLGPIGKTTPYYAIEVDSPTNAWTAKLVFVAANAWDATQSSWLSATLAKSTTYTFIIRHESATASTAPGVSPSEAIMKQHPYTLSIVGHAHTYGHPSAKEVLFGNGGAPLTSGNYGFGLVTQRSDGAIVVDSYDYASMKADPSFHFVVKADGTPTK